jgi:hypothetical protein
MNTTTLTVMTPAYVAQLTNDLAACIALNPAWILSWDLVDGEVICRLQNFSTREEVNGNGPTQGDAMEILLVRMELSGRFEMAES